MVPVIIKCSFLFFSPHLCVGFLFLILYPVPPPSRLRPASVPPPCPTPPSFTHNFVTTHNFFTHHLSRRHTHTHHLSHTQLCHTPSFTHNLVTHHLSHTTLPHSISLHLSHTTLSHTLFHTQLRRIISHAGVALGDLHLRFAWHLATSTFVSRGRRGTYGTGLALVARANTTTRWMTLHNGVPTAQHTTGSLYPPH